MAVEAADGFDTYTAAQAPRYHLGAGINQMITGYGSLGQAAALYNSAAIPFSLTARAEYIFAFDFYSDNSTNNVPFFVVDNLITAAVLTLGRGSVPTTLTINGTPYTGVLTGVWQNITVRVVASATVGVLTVRLDGNVIYDGTGLNTGAPLLASATFIGPPTSYLGSHYFDNFAAFNTLGTHSNALPTGRVRVAAYHPNSDGSYSGFVPDSGSTHYTRVNDAQPDDDTSYVSSAVAVADSYGIESLPGSGISQVHAVQVRVVHRKDDVNPKVLHVTAQSGLVISETADIAPGSSYAAAALLLTDDPNTGSQWGVAGVNSMQIGVKEIS